MKTMYMKCENKVKTSINTTCQWLAHLGIFEIDIDTIFLQNRLRPPATATGFVTIVNRVLRSSNRKLKIIKGKYYI